jgi:MFS family permease
MEQKVLLCALLCMIGLGLTLALTPIMAEIAYVVDTKEKKHPPGFFGKNGAYASAYSLFNMAWAAGCLIGPLLGGLINSSKGWPTMTLVLGCLSAFTAIPAVIWTSGSLFKLRRKVRTQSS